MLEKKISCTSVVPRPHNNNHDQDDLLLSVMMDDAEPEASGVGVISSSSYKSSESSYQQPPPLSFLIQGKEPISSDQQHTTKAMAISTTTATNHEQPEDCDSNNELLFLHQNSSFKDTDSSLANRFLRESSNCGTTVVNNVPGGGRDIPLIPGIVLSASDDGSIFGEEGFDEPLLLDGIPDDKSFELSVVKRVKKMESPIVTPEERQEDGGGNGNNSTSMNTNMSIVPYTPPWFPLPEEQIQFTMEISPAAPSFNTVPMSISQDNVVLPEMVQVGNTADGCQKAGMESNFESVLPAFTKATAEEDCASLTATSEIAKNGDIKRLNNNHGGGSVSTEDEDSRYDVTWVPPDGGFGWMVLMGSLIVNILIPGMVKSYGVLFIEFLEVFEASPASAAWIPALSYWLYSSMGPFASALAIRFSHRKVTILGGILASAGLALSYFATSVTYLYVSYGIIGGLGAGLAYPIGVFMVGDYFTTKRGLANGLCTSGSALGSVVLPPILRALLNNYGYRIAILIMAGILLNVCFGALFYDPVEKHLKKVLVEREPVGETKEKEPEKLTTSPEKPKKSEFLEIQDRSLRTGPTREIAASLPIAIPTVHHNNDRELRDRRESGSIRRATFQIGHDTPQGESWSLKSMEGIGTSPLALRLMKEDTGGLGISPRTQPFRYRQVQNQSGNSLESTSDAGDGPSNIVPATGGQSRLNLTAIHEEDDNDSSDHEMMLPQPLLNSPQTSRNLEDWRYFHEVPTPLHQQQLNQQHKPLRLSLGGGNQVISSSQVNNTGLSRTLSVASNVSTSSFHYVSTIHHGSLLSALQAEQNVPAGGFPTSSGAALKASSHTQKNSLSRCSTCLHCGFARSCKRDDETDEAKERVIPPASSSSLSPKSKSSSISIFRKIIDFSLFKDGIYIIMLLSNSTTAVGYTNFIILLPAYAMELGFDKSQASLLLSVVAGFDFFGRIGGAALSDLRFVSRKWFYIVGLFFSGVSLTLLPLATSHRSLITYCACFGLASGTYVGVTAVILADELGPEKLGSSYGITLFVNGVFQLAGPPICGILLEKYEKYQPILMALGIILMMGASFWLAVPFIEHRRRQKEKEKVVQEQEAAMGKSIQVNDHGNVITKENHNNSISVV